MSDALAGQRIGIVGIGNMGLPMAERLLSAGAEVLGYDPDPAATDRLAGVSGEPVGDLSQLAELNTIILMLPGSPVVEAVMAQLADQLAPGTLIVDMSSSDPMRTRTLAAELRAKGLRFIDAPVSGGVKGAKRGTLTVLIGGSDEDVRNAEPMLGVFGTLRHVGPTAAGHALKALNNLLSATHLWITSEALLVGQRFGLDTSTMLDAINGSSGRSASTENKWPNFIVPQTFDSGFSLRLMLKDMKIATSLAAALDAPISLGDASVAEWQRAADALPENADHTEIARYLAENRELS